MGMGLVMAGFHYAEQNMIEFREAVVFEKKHLQEIIGDLEEIEELLKKIYY